MFQNINEIMDFIRKEEVRFVDFKMTDLKGRWKHLTIPAERFTPSLLQTGIGFDGSNYGYTNVGHSDMVFIPSFAEAVIDPFVKDKTLTMAGDVMVIGEKENVPFAQYPRNVAKAALAYMQKSGIADEALLGPEYEFHLFNAASRQIQPDRIFSVLRSDESLRQAYQENSLGHHNAPGGGYHADIPDDSCYDLRNAICANLKQFGVRVKYHHHEVGGSGQQEVEVELGDLLKLADDTMAAKYVIRNTAKQHGMTATFMPKPVYEEAGNGMHVHILLRKDGRPVFYDENGYAGLSETALYFIGGLLKHVKALCAFTNPSTNSYKRLVPGFEAPVTIGYALANRSSVIRIPGYARQPETKRFELRSPDGTCNPYYAFAAILMAGIDGVINRISPSEHNWGPFDGSLYDLPEEQLATLEHLPFSLRQACQELENDHDFLLQGNVFTKELINNWLKALYKDISFVDYVPHPAEFDLYYDL